MLRKFNEVCFQLENCRNELAIEKRTNNAMCRDIEELTTKLQKAERLLLEEKANSKLNKQILHDMLHEK